MLSREEKISVIKEQVKLTREAHENGFYCLEKFHQARAEALMALYKIQVKPNTGRLNPARRN